MKVYITKIVYKNGKTVHAYGRGEDGKRKKMQLPWITPRFYSDETITHSSIKKFIPNSVMGVDGRKIHTYETEYPKEIKFLREKVFKNTWEADLGYSDFIRYHFGIKAGVDIPKLTPCSVDIKLRNLYLDIETDDKDGMPDPDNPTAEILSMTIFDNYTNKYIILIQGQEADISADKFNEFKKTLPDAESVVVEIKYCSMEKDIYAELYNYITQNIPDIASGWNVIEFDIAYLKARAEKMKYEFYNLESIIHNDLMVRYERLHEGSLVSKKLDYCAFKVLGEKKVVRSYESTTDSWWNAIEEFMFYNLKDVWLTVKIDEKVGITKFFNYLAATAGCDYDNTLYATGLIDALLFHFLHGEVVLYSKKNLKGEKEKFEGGFVHDPVSGIFDNVVLMDLTAEYPNIIRALNLSPETITKSPGYPNDYYKLPFDCYSKKTPIGIIPRLLTVMIEERNKIKKEMQKYPEGSKEREILNFKQRVVKELNNSMYGVMAHAGFRLYTPEMSAIVTSIGRDNIRWVKKILQENGYTALYADTDSCFSTHNTITDIKQLAESANLMLDIINKSFGEFLLQYGYTGESYDLQIKCEKIFKRWFQSGTKKRYAGLVVYEDGKEIPEFTYIRGFDVRRSSSPPYGRAIQEVGINIMLHKGKEEFLEMVKTEEAKWAAKSIDPKTIGIPCGINQPLAKYKSHPIHITAALYSNRHLGKNFKYGDKPIYYYVNHPQTHVIALDWDEAFPADYVIDWENMKRRCLDMPLNPLMEALGLATKDEPKHRQVFDVAPTSGFW